MSQIILELPVPRFILTAVNDKMRSSIFSQNLTVDDGKEARWEVYYYPAPLPSHMYISNHTRSLNFTPRFRLNPERVIFL
jgi:hypothetical protein